MKEENKSSSPTEVKTNGIAFRLDWAAIQHLLFWGLLLGAALLLAMDGELLTTVLKQFIGTLVALYIGKNGL